MRAEVISIGDELTSGQRLDTNSQWLAERLGELGVVTTFHTTVADDLAANIRVFREALDRADLIVATGGLGPTADDLTRQALAETVGVDLVLDQASLEHIQALFARRQREMPPANRAQALFPRGSRVVPNPNGTAPGIDLTFPRPLRAAARVFCLPGVPAEMREMWFATVSPAIQETLSGERWVICHHRLKCFGVGESDLERMLPDLIRRGRDPLVGITVSQATITLRVTARGPTEEACRERMAPTIQTIHECLGDLVFGTGDDELQHVVARELAARQASVATVEASTHGLLAHWLGDATARLGATYAGGLVMPAGVPASWLDSLADPHDVAAWAAGARQRMAADFALAIGPFVPSAGDSAGTVTVALDSASGNRTRTYSLAGHPEIIAARTAKQALNFLRLDLR